MKFLDTPSASISGGGNQARQQGTSVVLYPDQMAPRRSRLEISAPGLSVLTTDSGIEGFPDLSPNGHLRPARRDGILLGRELPVSLPDLPKCVSTQLTDQLQKQKNRFESEPRWNKEEAAVPQAQPDRSLN